MDKVRTTGIGSLPHPFLDAGLQFSLGLDIPFLPQFPRKGESMLWQVLAGLPGMRARDNGTCFLDRREWEEGYPALVESLDSGFSSQDFGFFTPDPELWSGWQPFLFEMEERAFSVAKMQVAGPLTCQWSLQWEDGTPAGSDPSVGIQIYRWILARTLFMAGAMQSRGGEVVVFVDEPGLYGFSKEDGKHRAGLEELRLFFQTLRKKGVRVGLHCCSNTEWETVLGLPLDWVSFDAPLSLKTLLPSLPDYLERGGQLAFGLIPSDAGKDDAPAFVEALLSQLRVGGDEKFVRRCLEGSLVTPTCGLGLHPVGDAERVGELVRECGDLLNSFLGPGRP